MAGSQALTTGGAMSAGSIWDTIGSTLKDNKGIIGLGMDVLGGAMNYAGTKDSQQNMNDAWEKQNPWAKNQEWAGGKLKALLENPDSIKDTERYQFQLDQGMDALSAKQAQSGNRFSGRAMEETMQFGQGLAGQMYNEEIQRWSALAGADQVNQGGMQWGENMSQIGRQGNFDLTYQLNKILNGGGGQTKTPGINSQYYWNS
jgi:hypothetical protein